MATTAEKQDAVKIRTALKGEGIDRFFIYDEQVGYSYSKEFYYHNQDLKLLKFAQDQVGAISDCYLLYAVAVLGVADMESIRLFLYALSKRFPELYISDMSAENKEVVRDRLTDLLKNGFLFKHSYTLMQPDQNGKVRETIVALYSIPKSAQSFINMKLERSTVIQEWLHAKPTYVLEGWAACSYIAVRLAQNPGFLDLKQGWFKTSVIGSNNLANVLKMRKKDNPDTSVYVGFMYSYLHFNKALQTNNDYLEMTSWLLRRLKQFLYSHDIKKHMVRLVIVVEENADLVEFARFITSSEELASDYDRIFFTGEGVIRRIPDSDTNFKKCFLGIRKTRTKVGYEFIPADNMEYFDFITPTS